MLLLSMSVLGWWLEQEKRDMLLWIAALLDEVAAEQKLVKILPGRKPDKPPTGIGPEPMTARHETAERGVEP